GLTNGRLLRRRQRLSARRGQYGLAIDRDCHGRKGLAVHLDREGTTAIGIGSRQAEISVPSRHGKVHRDLHRGLRRGYQRRLIADSEIARGHPQIVVHPNVESVGRLGDGALHGKVRTVCTVGGVTSYRDHPAVGGAGGGGSVVQVGDATGDHGHVERTRRTAALVHDVHITHFVQRLRGT